MVTLTVHATQFENENFDLLKNSLLSPEKRFREELRSSGEDRDVSKDEIELKDIYLECFRFFFTLFFSFFIIGIKFRINFRTSSASIKERLRLRLLQILKN